MGAWAILAFCIVAEVSATSLLTRSEGFARPVYGLLALVILGGCFWALSQLLTRTHGFGVRDLVWGWHSADLRRSTRAGTSERSGARTQAAPYHSRLLKWCGCFSTDVNDI